MRVLVGCLALHALLAGIVRSVWWTPDLTLLGLVVAVIRTPRRWLVLAVVAGLWAMVWAIRFPVQILMSYVALGWAVQALATRWDVTDPRVQGWVVGLTSLLMMGTCFWLDDLWSMRLLGLMLLRAGLTVMALRVLRRLTASRLGGPSRIPVPR